MIRADSDKTALVVGDDRCSTAGSPSRATVGGAEMINAWASGKATGNKIYVAVACSGEIIDCDPLLVLGTSAGRTVDRRQPCRAVIGGTEHLDHIGVSKSQGREVNAARGTVTCQHWVACVAGCAGWQRTAISPGSAAIGRARPTGEVSRTTRVRAGVVEAGNNRVAEGERTGRALGGEG